MSNGGSAVTNARAKRNDRIDRLMEQTTAARRAGDVFDAERFAAEALTLSFRALDFDRMTSALAELQGARESLRALALAVGAVHTLDSPGEPPPCEPGCWLVAPPRVGAEARALRDAGLDSRQAVLVVCREPLTQTGLWPLVCVGPCVVRTRIKPPRSLCVEWFVEAVEAVGAAAIDEVDPGDTPMDRLERLFERLQSAPDSLALHDAVAEACRDAANQDAKDAAGPAPARRESRRPDAGAA